MLVGYAADGTAQAGGLRRQGCHKSQMRLALAVEETLTGWGEERVASGAVIGGSGKLTRAILCTTRRQRRPRASSVTKRNLGPFMQDELDVGKAADDAPKHDFVQATFAK